MVRPLFLCLEDLAAVSDDERWLCCVAAVGRAPGLRITHEGRAAWRIDEGVTAELWTSADEQLVLYRLRDAVEIVLRRGERTLRVPTEKPVIVLHGDRIMLAEREHLVHVHGFARTVTAPYWYRPAQLATAAAIALSAALGACHENPPAVQSGSRAVAGRAPHDAGDSARDEDASIAAVDVMVIDAGAEASDALQAEATAATLDAGSPAEFAMGPVSVQAQPKPSPKPIEVRNHPPGPSVRDPFPQTTPVQDLQVAATLEALRPRLRACILQEREKRPGASGTVTLKVTIAPTGRVTNVKPQGGESLGGAVGCIVQAMRAAQFKASGAVSGPVTIEVPLRFSAPP
jgi:TonB family protein